MPPNRDSGARVNATEPGTTTLSETAVVETHVDAMSVADREREQAAQVRWNLGALMLDVTFFSLGMAFMDATAVLPLLLERLGASGPLIGGFASVRFLAFSLFQIFVSYGTHGKARQKPWLSFVAAVTRLPLLALPWFVWYGATSPASRSLALWMMILLLSFWALGDGLGYVPWMEIVARAFTARTRGRFFASTQLASGVCSVLIAAFVVRWVLHSPALPFPHNYALLLGVAAILFQISLVGVLLIREPPPPAIEGGHPPLPPLAEYFRRLPALVRANPVFARLAAIQLLLGFGSAAAPFYVLYATDRFHLGDEWGGIYQMMGAVGVVALMPAWAWLSERRGPGASVRGVAVACLLTPILAMTLGLLSPWLFGAIFLLMGGSLNWGMWITLNHFLLSHVAEEERSIYVALLNLLFTPSALFPFLGGLLVRDHRLLLVGGVPILFLLTTAVILAGLLLTLRLPTLDEGADADVSPNSLSQ
jgi:MFS family permease